MADVLYVKKSKVFRSTDVILVILILVIIGLSFALAFQKDEGKTVEIYLDGELLYRVPLNIDKVIEIDNVGKIIIENNTVRVQEMDCPNKICEQQGAISRARQSIICLPNKLIVTVIGESNLDVII